MKYLLILFLFVSRVYSQETAANFYRELCKFETDGVGNSLTLKIRLTIPCAWIAKQGERPNIVKKFTYSLSDKSVISTNLLIKKLPSNLPQKEMQKLLNEEDLKDFVSDGGKAISARKIKIDGVDGGELISTLTRESPLGTIYMNTILYIFVYKNRVIQITYNLGSDSKKKTAINFEKYKLLFKYLATKTIFLDKYL